MRNSKLMEKHIGKKIVSIEDDYTGFWCDNNDFVLVFDDGSKIHINAVKNWFSPCAVVAIKENNNKDIFDSEDVIMRYKKNLDKNMLLGKDV